MRLKILLGSVSSLVLILAVACQPSGGPPVNPTSTTSISTPTTASTAEATSTTGPTSTTEPTTEMSTSTPEMSTSTPARTATLEMTPTMESTSAPSTTATMTATLSSADMMSHGKDVFMANCSGCHGPAGQGSPAFPALAGNADITATNTMSITQFVLFGQKGQHEFGSKLSDLDIASVLTFIRGSWGNAAAPVTVNDVQAARQSPRPTSTP